MGTFIRITKNLPVD